MNIEQIERWLAWAFAVIVILSPIAAKARPHALAWVASSARTKTTIDDGIAKALLRVIDGLAWLVAIWPRITLGLGEAKRVRDAIKSVERPVKQ